MALLEIKNLTFTYPDDTKSALKDITLSVCEGDFIVLCGPSGSGKSTLLRLIKQEIAPYGSCSGELVFNGQPLTALDDATKAKEIGMVFQDPENQIVMDTVMEELVFGLENIGLSTQQMRKRIAEIVHFFGMDGLIDQPTQMLSGGQMQMVNLASILLMEPRVLLLDEPTSQLDPIAAKEFINILRRMNEELGIAVIIAEHRLEDIWPLADRVVVLENGTLRHEGVAKDVVQTISFNQKDAFFDYLPAASRLFLHFHSTDGNPPPITVKEGRQWVETLEVSRKYDPESESFNKSDRSILEARAIDFQYEKLMPRILNNLNLEIRKQEKLAIVGGNGTGKSTLLKVLAGLYKPQRGRILFNQNKVTGKLLPEIGYLPQNPRLYFSENTVRGEMALAERHRGVTDEERADVLNWLNFNELKERHPYDLSGGEMQKLAMACLLLRNPEVLLIDEPTKGLDPSTKNEFGDWLNRFNKKGLTIVFVTHDIEFAANYADRVAMMFQGDLTALDSKDNFFKGNGFYTTSVDRMTYRTNVPEVLTVKEAERVWDVQESSSFI